MDVALPVGHYHEAVGLHLHLVVNVPDCSCLVDATDFMFLNVEDVVAEVQKLKASALVEVVDHQDSGEGETVSKLLFVSQIELLIFSLLLLVHAE